MGGGGGQSKVINQLRLVSRIMAERISEANGIRMGYCVIDWICLRKGILFSRP